LSRFAVNLTGRDGTLLYSESNIQSELSACFVDGIVGLLRGGEGDLSLAVGFGGSGDALEERVVAT
jgi:hypothetical protein